jgi:hypothetical protein
VSLSMFNLPVDQLSTHRETFLARSGAESLRVYGEK